MYQFGSKFSGAPFCKTCGIHCFGNLYGPPKEVLATWPEARQAVVKKKLMIQPLNIRVLDNVEWDELKWEKLDVGTEGYRLPEE